MTGHTTGLRYEEPPPSTPADVRAAIAGGDAAAAARALVGAAFHHEPWREVQALCLELLEGADRSLAAVAATCLGHLARIHGQLDTDVVLPALRRHRGDETVGPHVEDALDDIDWYLEGRHRATANPDQDQ
jgi:hypothetical protein